MKYIETPVVYDKEDMTIWGRDGQWIATLALGWLAPELVTAINEHDKLTGLHDELVKQRDALFEALKEQELLSRHIRKCSAFDTQDGTCDTCLDLGYSAQKLRRVALALVRGKVEDETH